MSETSNSSSAGGCGCGFGLGTVGAAILSWAMNHSVWWAIFHFFCGWFYILYAVFFRTKEIVPALKTMFGI